MGGEKEASQKKKELRISLSLMRENAHGWAAKCEVCAIKSWRGVYKAGTEVRTTRHSPNAVQTCRAV
jgi:hypothetical protein